MRMQRLAEQVSQKLEERWTSQLLASAELTQRRQINKLLPHLPHLQPLSASLRKSTLQVQDLLWTRLVRWMGWSLTLAHAFSFHLIKSWLLECKEGACIGSYAFQYSRPY